MIDKPKHGEGFYMVYFWALILAMEILVVVLAGDPARVFGQ